MVWWTRKRAAQSKKTHHSAVLSEACVGHAAPQEAPLDAATLLVSKYMHKVGLLAYKACITEAHWSTLPRTGTHIRYRSCLAWVRTSCGILVVGDSELRLVRCQRRLAVM